METIIVKKIASEHAQTRLERDALRWLNASEDYNDGATGRYKDLMHGGCQSGIVRHLIYSRNCRTYLKRHHEEINRLLGEMIDEVGGTGPADVLREWDKSDPLGLDVNADRLAWFGFETAAHTVAQRAGIDA